MTEWSGPEFIYRSNVVSNQATKPKLHGVHKVLQNQHQHQHCHDCKNLALTSLSVLLTRHTALRKMFPPLTFCFWWPSDQGKGSLTLVMWLLTKPQSQTCVGITYSHITYTNTAMIVETSLLLLSLLQSYHQHCHYCRNIAQASLSQSHWQGTALRNTATESRVVVIVRIEANYRSVYVELWYACNFTYCWMYWSSMFAMFYLLIIMELFYATITLTFDIQFLM
jgi:hypothetical protein